VVVVAITTAIVIMVVVDWWYYLLKTTGNNQDCFWLKLRFRYRKLPKNVYDSFRYLASCVVDYLCCKPSSSWIFSCGGLSL